MPRIRSIKPEHRAHRKVGPLSDREYRLWVSMIVEADDEGRFIANAAQLKAQTWPYHGVSSDEVEQAIQTITKLGSIRLYHVGKTRYGVFTSWAEHQHPKYPQRSRYPSPPFPHRSPNGAGMVRKRSTGRGSGLRGSELRGSECSNEPPKLSLQASEDTPNGDGDHPVTFVMSDAWRKEHRAGLRAKGLTPAQADTEAGRLVAAEVVYYRQHGQRRPNA